MHVLTFTAASASETPFNMTCWQTDEQTNKLVDVLKIGTLMRPSLGNNRSLVPLKLIGLFPCSPRIEYYFLMFHDPQ